MTSVEYGDGLNDCVQQENGHGTHQKKKEKENGHGKPAKKST